MTTSISTALSQLHTGPQWFEADDRKFLLAAVGDETFAGPKLAAILYHGRYGLARVVDRNGLEASNVVWLTGRQRPTTVRLLSRKRIRAVVVEHRPRWPS